MWSSKFGSFVKGYFSINIGGVLGLSAAIGFKEIVVEYENDTKEAFKAQPTYTNKVEFAGKYAAAIFADASKFGALSITYPVVKIAEIARGERFNSKENWREYVIRNANKDLKAEQSK
jgi:hypothetical protein